MVMAPRLRKFALAAHLTLSVGWIGAVVAYLALGAAAVTSEDPTTIRGAWVAMELTGWYVIVPLALASLLTGLLMALGTRWGLLRHYWVLFSLGLTVFAVAVLLLHMPTVTSTADIAQRADQARLETLGGDLGHPAIGLGVLLVIQVLNVYKPRGMTRHGQRKQHQTQASPKRSRGEERPVPTPAG
jgi:hypothetical protein